MGAIVTAAWCAFAFLSALIAVIAILSAHDYRRPHNPGQIDTSSGHGPNLG